MRQMLEQVTECVSRGDLQVECLERSCLRPLLWRQLHTASLLDVGSRPERTSMSTQMLAPACACVVAVAPPLLSQAKLELQQQLGAHRLRVGAQAGGLLPQEDEGQRRRRRLRAVHRRRSRRGAPEHSATRRSIGQTAAEISADNILQGTRRSPQHQRRPARRRRAGRPQQLCPPPVHKPKQTGRQAQARHKPHARRRL